MLNVRGIWMPLLLATTLAAQSEEPPTANACGPLCPTLYGEARPGAGRRLTISLLPTGVPREARLVVENAPPNSPVLLVWGVERTFVPLPWDDSLLVEPLVTLDFGNANGEGFTLRTIDFSAKELAGTTLCTQAFALAGGGSSSPVHSSPGLEISIVR